ncbi:MAG: universal stress protein [Chloroflexota bacterium]
MFVRILVPLDGSRLAERALQPALQLAERYLDRIAKTYRRVGTDMKTVIASGPAASEILDFASRYAVDLIVMATHGRSGLNRWVHGSVTGKVLRAGCCSMLIVPARFEDRTEALDAELDREHFDTPQPSPN